MGKKLAIEHHLIRPTEVIELLEMMGGKNKDNADGCSFLYYTLCTPKINNPNNEKVICGFTNLKMQSDRFAIFTLEKFWKKYPYKLNDKVLCDDGLLGVVTKMEWDCEKSDMKYYISFNIPVDNKWYSSKNIICKYIEAMEAIRKKLAIKGHPTRGKEVVELLEMMGGVNSNDAYGNLPNNWDVSYYIFKDGVISVSENKILTKKQFEIFTLEEFLSKYPFKVGDKVIDKADGCPGVVCEMKWDEDVSDMKYCVAFGNGIDFGWFANDSIEFCKNKNLDETKVESTGFMQVCKTAGIIFNDANYADEVELYLGDYEIVVRDGKTYAVLKKSKYPKTIEECVKLLRVDFKLDMDSYKRKLMANFYRLILCRDAYWKIVGEEMELGKPWEPKYEALMDNTFFTIQTFNGEIDKSATSHRNSILAFPTIEMRDTFYKNFKDLIEQCKELL